MTTATETRVLPHSLEAEVCVLGSMILDSKALETVTRICKADDFFRPSHRLIFEALCRMSADGKPIELFTLDEHLKQAKLIDQAGGTDYLANLAESVPSIGNAEYYAGLVRDKAKARKLIGLAGEIAERAYFDHGPAGELLDDARTRLDGLADGMSSPLAVRPAFKTARELVEAHPQLRPPVIEGLLREGETANVISASKGRKTCLVNDLALAVATGQPFLGLFPTVRADVLIVDNELHPQTTAHRLPQIAAARGLALDDWADRVMVDNVRGRGMTLLDLPTYFRNVKPGRFKVIVLDALYRFWPPGVSENDNAAIAACYNLIDRLADRLGCCFVVVHHTSKGNQTGKNLVDVGAGAGSIARAADAHIILLPHETDTRTNPVVVLDAAGRSFPPIEAVCLRFNWPVWTAAPELDPAALKPDRPRRPRPPPAAEPVKPTTDEAADFAAKYISKKAKTRATIIDAATQDGLSAHRAGKLLGAAEGRDLAFRWTFGPREPIRFTNVKQPELDPIGEAK